MIWLSWRQFRVQAWVAIGGLVVVAIALAVTGPHLAHLYNTSGLASCVADNDCESAQTAFSIAVQANDAYALLYFAGIAILYLAPVVIGMFWGAPLVARDLEAGTFRLTWTQSVTRPRWLAAKLGVVGLAAVLAAGLLSLAVTWWSSPIDQANGLPGQDQGIGFPNRFMPLVFGARDIVPIGYAAFAFALGVTVGILVRRTVPAMAVTLAVLAAVQMVVPMSVRAHYLPPAHTTTALTLAAGTQYQIGIQGNTMTVSTPVTILGAWITSVQTVDAAGRSFTGTAPQACLSMTNSQADCHAAINQLRLQQLVAYQPAGRYWTFQWYETAIYLTLALAIAGLCVWRIRRFRLS
ncbi:ABC transporter permease [Micromonospora sp. NPDC000668]|uniref:ABC transporter permease n=1 Tax=Micromonospora sp. NPDC000668 TaxID=3364219 RepID=UPI00368EB817